MAKGRVWLGVAGRDEQGQWVGSRRIHPQRKAKDAEFLETVRGEKQL